ncbi:MAG: GWxTD domain-containing protein [Bacteroidota bacterium]
MRRGWIEILFAVCGFLCVLAGFSPLQAQDEERERFGEGGRSGERSPMEIVSFEPHMFAEDSGLVRVDILYRVRFDFFVFTRDFSTNVPSYRAHGELLIELIDSTDTSVSRKVQAISLDIPDNEITQLRLQYYQGAASFVVHPGRFTTVYHLEDNESQREFGDRKQILRVVRFRPDAVVRSTALFIEPTDRPLSERSFTALNDNNAAQFSKNTGTVLTIKDENAPVTVRYSLTQFMPEDRERIVVQEETTATATVIHHSLLRLLPTNSGNIEYVLDSNATTATVYFPLLTSHLKQGQYTARIHISAKDTATVNKEFSIRWRDMPLSLYDLDFSVSAMRYITTDSEYDDLRSGSRDARIKKFEEFWAKRNNVPGSAYNEMMAVYFQRVDYAFANFRTLREENGVLTDRGKIYILYGKPSNIERSLAPGGPPREVWTYASLNKEFIFEDPSRQGNYKLIASGTK